MKAEKDKQVTNMNNKKPLPIEDLNFEVKMLGMGYAGLKTASAKDADALYMAIVELGDEPEAPTDDGNGGLGIEFYGTNLNYTTKEDLYDKYVEHFYKLS